MTALKKLPKHLRRSIARHWRYWIVTRKMRVFGTWRLDGLQIDDGLGEINITIMGSGL